MGWQVHPDADTLQVRAGEGQSEADNYVLTNTVYKTSMSSGLSSKGKASGALQLCSYVAAGRRQLECKCC